MAEQPLIASLIEAIPLPSVLHSPSGEIVAANRKAADVLGLTVETLMGRQSLDPRWRALDGEGAELPGQNHPAMRAIELNAPVGPSIMGVELPSGDRRWIRVNAIPVEWPTETERVGCLASFSLIQKPHVLQNQEPTFVEQASRSNLFHLMSSELEKLRAALRSATVAFARRDNEGAEVASIIANSSIDNIAKWRDLYFTASWILHPGRADRVRSELSEIDKVAGVFIDFDGLLEDRAKNAYLSVLFIYRFLKIINEESTVFTARANLDGQKISSIQCYSDVGYSEIYNFLSAHIYDVVSHESCTSLKELCCRELFDLIFDALDVQFIFINENQNFQIKLTPN